MEQSYLVENLPAETCCVYQRNGIWFVRTANLKSGSVPLLALLQCTDDGSGTQLIFENRATLGEFLADGNPLLEAFRTFVRRMRTCSPFIVMTVDELMDRARSRGTVTDLGEGFWVKELPMVKIEGSPWDRIVFDSLNHTSFRPFWCLRHAVEDEPYAYRFTESLARWQQLEEAAHRRRHALAGEPVIVRGNKSQTGFKLDKQFWGPALIVPQAAQRPTLRAYIAGAYSSGSYYDVGFIDEYEATLYPFNDPESLACRDEPLDKRSGAVRTLPLDVLTAGCGPANGAGQ